MKNDKLPQSITTKFNFTSIFRNGDCLNNATTMRKNTFIRKALVAIMFLMNIISYSQNFNDFTPRFDQDVRGDMFLIGNNILNRDTNSTNPNNPYNGGGVNGDFDMQYIDIDGDNTTFSSSSATLASPRPNADNCYKIIYAGLYWGATLQSGSRADINKVKFKLPTGGYINITGQVIHDVDASVAPLPTSIGGDNMKPYACYADVTSLVAPLVNPVGTYTVANVLSSQGFRGGTGNSAGWSLFIVYEDPTLTSKSIVSFDGLSGIGGAGNLSFPVSGFRTIPVGPVRAKFAMTALEGDQQYVGDYLRINGTTISQVNAVPTTLRPTNNFFNSSITDINGYMNAATQRTPNSSNTLGYDAAVLNIANGGNAVIANNATSATIELGSTQDVYFYFFNAFAVDIIAPEIQLTKDVENVLGVPIGGANVNLGQQLNYEIGFQNIGNDNATSFTISDVLPVNVVFNPADLALPGALPPGVTFTFTAPRTLTFTIPNNLVEVGDPRFIISIRVHVVNTCYEMDDACSNLIQNQAFATYSGTFNTSVFSDEGSIAAFGACGFGTPGSTNFLVGLDNCDFTRTEVICPGNSITLTAAPGYQTYTWSGPGTITPISANGQVVSVSQPGTYIVNNIINTSPCKSIVETINVVGFGINVTNPVIPVADHIAICPIDNKELPFIYLCGAGDTQFIPTNILGALSYSWEKLIGCTITTTNPNCANDDASCTWNVVGTASSYTAASAGEYRLVIKFQGNCERIFYFNVFQNQLAPTVSTRDIICTTSGQITVNNVPAGYLYSLTPAGSPPGSWGTNNVFTINTAGVYTVHIQQPGVVNGCIFTVPNIAIQNRTFSVTPTFIQPLCFGEKGSITLVANGVDPQYTFTINQGATVINSVGPINANNWTFSGLNPGNYSYTVTTQNGCTATANFTINNPALLTVTATLTIPITCNPGEITIYPVGGVAPYTYFINGVSQLMPQYVVTTPGLYTIQIIDSNNCVANTSITVPNNPPPVFTVTQTNVLCYGDNSGAINFNVTNANGYTLGYSITGGAPFGTNPNFTNLSPGTYTAVLQYTLGAAAPCLTAPQTITITAPSTALTASGGVAAVACSSNGGNGIVRITNVQGGTPYPAPNLYQYNFGSGYQNLNQANLPPGTYTIYVRDANLCEFPMTVTLDPIPPDPTITVGAPTFSCTGSATSTVTVNNGASSYTYQYFIDVPLTPPHDPNSNVFNNVPCGPHVVTVNYTLVTPSTFSNLLREDFGVGAPTTTSGINTAYCFENQSGVHPPGYTCNLDNFINDGEYGVTNRINPRFGAWNDPRDHTTNGVNPNGRFLCVNIGGTAGIGGIIYSKPITDIIPNQDIQVSLWAMNLILPSSPTLGDPNLTIQLIANLGLPGETLVATTPVASPIIVPKSNRWEFYTLALNPGAYTSLSFVIRSYSNIINGNDVVIDDINVFQLPVSCLGTRNFPINIACNQAFAAQVVGHTDVTCSGLNNGTVTIAAQNFNAVNGFQVSMNNGATWTTHLTSPVIITAPAGYPGFVLVRYDATPGNAACTFNLPQVITTPAVLTSSATFTPITCIAGSTITATANGGTLAYQYQLTNSVGGIIVPFQSSSTFTNIPAGSYIVVVRDANLCTTNSSTIVIASPNVPTLTLAASDFCYDSINAATLVVTAAGGVAPYQYHINGGVLQSSNTFPNVQPGTHTIEVVDAYGCTASITNIVVAPQLSAIAVVTKDLDCSASPDAVITVTVSGGYTPFTYRVRKGAGAFSAVTPFVAPSFTYTVTAANADTYTFEITDARGCITTVTATINPITNPTATTVNVNPTCNGLTNGSVQIVPAGGSGTYTFSFNGSAFTATSLYTGLSGGIAYPYQVRDSKGCLFNGTVTLTQPASLTETHTVTPFSCNAANTHLAATITVNGSGGTGPYEYSFLPAGFTSTNTITINDNGTNQTINFIVRDSQGCTVPGSVVLNRLNPPVISTVTATPVTCTATTSTATVTATNGVGVLTYAITLPAASATSNTTGIFTGLAPGSYVFQVTDANGCYDTESFNILPVTPIAVTGIKLSDVLCNGGNTGAIQFTVSGFSTTYSYSINAGVPITGQTATTINLPNLIAGNYTIQVTDAVTGCTASATITITQPASALAFTATTTNVSCNNDISQIVVTASGGTPTYTYAAVISGAPAPVTYATSNILNVDTNSATLLNWDVYVRDANGCVRMNPVSIISDPLPTVTAPALASNQCTVSTNFIFTATGISGVPPLTFSIGGAFQSSPTFVVTPGSYTITIRDGNGCTASSATQTNVYPVLIANSVLTDDLNCSAPTNGNIQVTVGGGLAPYSYQLFQNMLPVTGVIAFPGVMVNIPVTNVANYTVVITDANGCTRATNVVTTTPAIPPTATVLSTSPTCNAGTNGSITLNAAGGEVPYLYSINGAGGPFVGTNVFGGLSAGTYNYVIRDNRGCTVSGSVVLTNPPPIVVNVVRNGIVCNVNTLGSFDVTITSGGVAPFIYTLLDSSFVPLATSGSTAATTYSFPGLTFGDYYINIVDANGCQFLSTRQRIETQPLLTFTAQVDSNNCATGVAVTVTTSGGAPNFTYSIFGGPILFGPTPSTTYTFNNLNHGTTYLLQVQDANNCISILEFTTPPPPSTINITGTTQTNVTCTGANNGTLAFTVQNFNPAVTNISYELLNALTNLPVVPPVSGTLVGPAGGPVSGSISGLPAGNYTIIVREATGTLCSAVYTFQITQPVSLPTATIQSEVNANCNFGAQVVISATGGTPPYQYAYVPDGTPQGGAYGPSNTGVLNLPTINWDIWIRDANGCEFKIDKTIIRDADPTINAVALQCFTGAPLNITITGTVDPAVVGATTYSIGGAYQASPNFVINAPGIYTISIKDGNGCIASTTYEVKPQVQLNATLTQDLTCVVDASITLVASGGTGIYPTYQVSYNAGSPTPIAGTTYTTTLPGTYEFSVTDSQGCPATSNVVVVTPRTSPTFTFVQTNVSCNGGNNGSITITAANGLAPYQYSINNGVTYQASNQFLGLTEAGVYTIIVRDSKGCVSPATPVDITDPDPVAGVGVLTQGLTCGAANATQPAIITITASGGIAPYTYSFDGGINYTTTNTYTTSTAGTVTAYIKDANGCIIAVPINVIVPALNPPTDITFNATAVTCIATTSDVTLSTVNGVSPFTYAIISPTPVAHQASAVFTGLAPNTYLFEVRDVNGCTYREFYTVTPVTNITVSGQLISNVSCNGGNNGAVQFTVANFAGTYSYSVNAGPVVTAQNAPTINLSGLIAGNYQINITDEVTGCTATATVTVNQPAVLTLVVDTNINANCNFGAQVTVHGVGGTAPYTYAFVQNAVVPNPGDYSTSNTAVLNPATNTSWDVHVLDANNCHAQIDVIITTDPLPSAITATVTSQCPSPTGTYTFTVNVGVGVAPFEYSIGTGFQTSPIFTVNAPGTYNITVRDANGCINAIAVPVTILPALQLQAQITTIPTCNDPDGEVTLTASGGSVVPSYEYSADGVTYVPSNVFAGLAPGTYTFSVRDTGTTCVDTVTITIEPATIITGLNAIATPVSCNGGNNGTITVQIGAPSPGVNDNPIYTYQLNAGAPQTSNVFSGLTAGSYTIQVNSGRGCIATQIVVVNEPAVVTVPAPIVAQFACTAGSNSTNFATITVTGVTGGSNVYSTYEFILGGVTVQSGSSNIYTSTNLLGGTYTVNVYDTNGCLGSTTAVINPFIGMSNTINVAVTNPITCVTLEDIAVSVVLTGGSTTLNYTIDTIPGTVPQTNTTGIFTGLAIGDYLITVTNPITNCSVQVIHYVFDPNTFILNVAPVSDVICVGGSDGSVTLTIVDNDLTPTNDAGPFSFIVHNNNTGLDVIGNSPNAGPVNVPGLTAGVYTATVTLTNDPTCPISSNFTILEPSAALDVTATNTAITCIPGTDGTITATATGGWGGPYQYQLVGPTNVPFSANNVFTGLGAGNYTVNVRDVKLCQDSFSVILSVPAPIAATITPNTAMLPCFGDTSGTITISYPTGGQGSNYSYVLNTILPTPSTSAPITIPLGGAVITGLGAGTYNVTIQDTFGCILPGTNIVIDDPNLVVATLSTTVAESCNQDTVLTLTATGGTPPFTYSADGVTYSVATFNPSVNINVPLGSTATYAYYIKDVNGCTSAISNPFTNIPPDPILITLVNQTDILCGGPTGALSVTAQGGLGNYVYSLVDAIGNPIVAGTQLLPGQFTNLPAGTYYVQVVSNGGCTATAGPYTFVEPPLLTLSSVVATPVKCSSGADGTITLTINGGLAPYYYFITPSNQQTEVLIGNVLTISNLTAGFYDVTVQDNKGCIAQALSIEIETPDPLTTDIVTHTDLTCTELVNGTITINNIQGGTPPFSATLNYVTHYDNSFNPPLLVDDSAYVSVNGAGGTSHVFSGLTGGSYPIAIKDANGCVVLDVIDIDPGVAYTPAIEPKYDCINNAPYVELTAVNTQNLPSGAFPANGGFLFSLDVNDVNVAQLSPTFNSINFPSLLTPGTHIIYVFSASDCNKASTPYTINTNDVDPLVVTLVAGPGLNEVTANVNNSSGQPSGTPLHTYVFSSSTSSHDNGHDETYIYDHSGVYTVTVTDERGCTAQASLPVTFIPIFIPNVFTPNGPGWSPQNTANYKDLTTDIFDRYGRKVKEMKEGDTWDGKYNGKELPSGDYWYVIKIDGNNDKEYVGHFTLYR